MCLGSGEGETTCITMQIGGWASLLCKRASIGCLQMVKRAQAKASNMAGVEQATAYDKENIFPIGSVWHAAETGSFAELKQAEAKGQACGYPPLVTLQLQDGILQCQPLHVAAEKGQIAIVQYLIQNKVDLDSGDGHMVRPLHLAAITNHLDIVKLLIDKGANPTKQDSDGDVPLHWAATKGHAEMMEMLMDRGSAVDAPNRQGWTALHRAAYTGHVAACRLLLRRGAGINALTRDGRTALHLAALQNHLGVLELLLDMGAGTHFRDQQGALAADLCIGDAARDLLKEKANQTRTAGVRSNSRPVSSTASTAAAAAPASGLTATTAKAASRISHVPEMPRFVPTRNINLDADGFPVAVSAQQHDLQAGASGDAAGTELLFVQQLEAEAEEQLQQHAMLAQEQQARSASSSRSVSYSGRPSQQQPGQLLSAPSFSRSSRSGSVVESDVRSTQDRQQQAALLGAQQKPAGPNKKFLQQYGLHKMGLFAP